MINNSIYRKRKSRLENLENTVPLSLLLVSLSLNFDCFSPFISVDIQRSQVFGEIGLMKVCVTTPTNTQTDKQTHPFVCVFVRFSVVSVRGGGE